MTHHGTATAREGGRALGVVALTRRSTGAVATIGTRAAIRAVIGLGTSSTPSPGSVAR